MSDQAKKLTIAGVLAIALAGVAIALSQGGSEETEPLEAEDAAALFDGIPQAGTILGEPGAPVTVIEFGDMQCPFCADFAAEGVPQVLDELVRPGEVALDLQVLSFIGPDSERLARLVAAASLQDLAWPMAEVLYSRQGAENSGYATDEFLREAAGAVPGLDVERALEDATSAAAERVLAAAGERAAELEVQGTPAFFAEAGAGGPEPLRVDPLDGDGFAAAVEPLLPRSGG